MFEWTDKRDNIDTVLAEDINKIGRAIVKMESTYATKYELEEAIGKALESDY